MFSSPTSLSIAIASLLLPGAGHLLAGRRRAGSAWMAPPLLLLAIIAGWTLLAGPAALLSAMLLTPVALVATIAIMAFGAWHIVSLLSALVLNARRGASRPKLAIHALLAVLLLVPYGWATSLSWAVYQTDSAVFVGRDPKPVEPQSTPPDFVLPSGDPEPGIVTPSGSPAATPAPLPISDDLTVLVIGSDALSARECCGMTDTLMVVNYDPASTDMSMLSLPRDIASFPLSTGAVYSGKLNSLLSYAQSNPALFGGGDPHEILLREVGFLLGIEIDHYLLLDLDGALELAQVFGGLTVNNPSPIEDPGYEWNDGSTGFFLPAGRQRLSGEQLIAFTRSRQGAGDNDFTRAARQQEVIDAVARALLTTDGISRLPTLLPAVARNVRTDMRPADAGNLLRSIAATGTGGVQRVVLRPPYTYHPPVEQTAGSWELRLDMAALAELSRELYGDASAYSIER